MIFCIVHAEILAGKEKQQLSNINVIVLFSNPKTFCIFALKESKA